ncbi:hypothetical protein VTH06DRAFT_6044 [Thermothelomyces fergusii]
MLQCSLWLSTSANPCTIPLLPPGSSGSKLGRVDQLASRRSRSRMPPHPNALLHSTTGMAGGGGRGTEPRPGFPSGEWVSTRRCELKLEARAVVTGWGTRVEHLGFLGGRLRTSIWLSCISIIRRRSFVVQAATPSPFPPLCFLFTSVAFSAFALGVFCLFLLTAFHLGHGHVISARLHGVWNADGIGGLRDGCSHFLSGAALSFYGFVWRFSDRISRYLSSHAFLFQSVDFGDHDGGEGYEGRSGGGVGRTGRTTLDRYLPDLCVVLAHDAHEMGTFRISHLIPLPRRIICMPD